MCGLVAILDWERGGWLSEETAIEAVNFGLDQMGHRGLPGRTGIVVHGKAVLGHVRLPIINLDTSADQPMGWKDKTIAFTGEILNYQVLAPEATSDTQALGMILAEYGLDAMHQVDGFWSAVVAEPGGAYAFTDHLAIKPLYYNRSRLLVASEPAVVARMMEGFREPGPALLNDLNLSNTLKWGYDPIGATPWFEVQKLPPGTVFASDGSVRGYWDWTQVPLTADEPLRDLIVEAVSNRLVGDREVALLLSGGLDSSIIFKILTTTLKRGVRVFHVPNAEEEYLDMVLAGYPSTALKVEPATIEQAVAAQQTPVDLGSLLPQTGLAKALRAEGLFICMSGDGADEVFGGYRRAKEYDSQASDVFCELPYYHLPRLDRVMMSETIELRSPYLAPKVVLHGLNLHRDQRRQKEALKSAFRHILPKEIVDRPKQPLKSREVIEGGVGYRIDLQETWRFLYDS